MAVVQIERRKRGFFGWLFLGIFLLFNAFMLFSCVSGVASVSSTYNTAASEAERSGVAIGTTIGIGMILAIWLAGAVILGIFVLLTRGPRTIETVGETAALDGANSVSGIPNSPSDAPRRGIPWWGWAIGGVFGLVALGSLFQGAPQRATSATAPASQSSSNDSATTTDSSAPTSAETTPENWTYVSRRDEMRNATDAFATSPSTNHVNFGFPYEDGQMSIILRKSAQYGRDIMISMHDGQFTCPYDGCSVHVKFDDANIQTFSVNESDSGRGDTLFIVNQSRFLSQLRTAHRVAIEAQFFDHGAEQFTFNVDGLHWEQ